MPQTLLPLFVSYSAFCI